jgi:1-acyl-sn-glycerol-3-phosphate acyltransferase
MLLHSVWWSYFSNDLLRSLKNFLFPGIFTFAHQQISKCILILMKLNIKNILVVLYAFVTVLLTLPIMIPALILMLFGFHKLAFRYLNRLAKLYAQHFLFVIGVRVKVNGSENLPDSNNICFVSNHQGLMDIPLITGYIPRTVGFIAKKELARIPIMNIWLRAMNCVMIDRSSPRSTISTIERSIRQIRKGHAMVIFPEGTRSRKHNMAKFKQGAFKLVTGADAYAVPLTINDTYRILEETKTITSAQVTLTIHPAIDVKKLSAGEKAKLHEVIEETIRSGLITPPSSNR